MSSFRRYSAAPKRGPFVAVAVAAAVAAALLVPQNAFAATASPAAASSSAAGSSSSSSTAPTAKALTETQKLQVVWQDVDDVRAQAGKPVLVRNSALDKVAADWAKQQYLNGAMSHNPNYSSQIPAGWQRAGENVAKGYYYNEVVDAWVASSSHYANLVNDYTDIGIGYYEADGRRYWSQVFAKYPSTQVPARTAPASAPAPSATQSATPTPAPTATTKPTTAPSSAPATAPSTPATAAAEPAAPAGTAIPLTSSSFEGSSTGWTGSNLSLVGPNSEARGGKYALGVTGKSTVAQTVTVATTPGETYTATIWVRPATTTAVSGTVKLTTVGGTAETGSISYKASSGWMKVTVQLKVAKAGHTGLTLSVVQSSGSARLDSASLVRTGNAPAATAAAAPAPASSSAPAASSTPAPSKTSTASAPAAAPAPAPAAAPAPAPAATPASTQSPGLVSGLVGGLLG